MKKHYKVLLTASAVFLAYMIVSYLLYIYCLSSFAAMILTAPVSIGFAVGFGAGSIYGYLTWISEGIFIWYIIYRIVKAVLD